MERLDEVLFLEHRTLTAFDDEALVVLRELVCDDCTAVCSPFLEAVGESDEALSPEVLCALESSLDQLVSEVSVYLCCLHDVQVEVFSSESDEPGQPNLLAVRLIDDGSASGSSAD